VNLRRLRLSILAALALAIFAVAVLKTFRASEPSSPVLKTLSSFSLVDRNAEPFGTSDLEGHIWVASFIYSTCPGPCPLVVRALRGVDERLAEIPSLRIVSISVDPDHDTPDVLEEYATTHAIPSGRWKLLTGDPDLVFATIRENFLLGVGAARDMFPEGTEEAVIAAAIQSDGPVAHSVRFALVDKKLNVRGYYKSTEIDELDRLVHDARRLSR
jgi:protein SCO1/2